MGKSVFKIKKKSSVSKIIVGIHTMNSPRYPCHLPCLCFVFDKWGKLAKGNVNNNYMYTVNKYSPTMTSE